MSEFDPIKKPRENAAPNTNTKTNTPNTTSKAQASSNGVWRITTLLLTCCIPEFILQRIIKNAFARMVILDLLTTLGLERKGIWYDHQQPTTRF